MVRKMKLSMPILSLLCLMKTSEAWRRRRRSCSSRNCIWEWSSCDASCGGGLRRPTITQGASCGGTCNLPQPEQCNTHCCKVDCVQSEWGNWSSCSKSCGANGQSMRNRSTTTTSACGGVPCGPTRETKSCNRICLNMGTVHSSKCNCTRGWKGECCESDRDECAEMQCTTHSRCMNSFGSYECLCDSGYRKSKSNLSCIDVDECSSGSHDCNNASKCINLIGEFKCQCDPAGGNGGKCSEASEVSADGVTSRWIGVIVASSIALVSIIIAIIWIKNRKPLKSGSVPQNLPSINANDNKAFDPDYGYESHESRQPDKHTYQELDPNTLYGYANDQQF